VEVTPGAAMLLGVAQVEVGSCEACATMLLSILSFDRPLPSGSYSKLVTLASIFIERLLGLL